MTRVRATCEPLLWVALSLASTAAIAADTPQSWLDRMNSALTTRNYEGVFSHWQNGGLETLRIVHRVQDGAVTERLESLDGSGRQIVRDGAQLTCYLPDQRTVLVEKAPPTLLPGGLPKFDATMAEFYRLDNQGTTRQMGQKAQLITVTPRDGFRYGYRLWIQRASGMPLKTELIDTDGRIIEEMVFSSLSLPHRIADEAFRPQLSTSGFAWLREDGAGAMPVEVPAEWSSTPLPPGFHLAAQTAQMMPGVSVPVTHLVFSDGVATVSVFIQTQGLREAPPNQVSIAMAQVGSSSAVTLVRSGHKYVALGEVPPATVRFIIDGLMRPSLPAPAPPAAARLEPTHATK